MAETLCTDPEHISISKSKGVKIDWKDGLTSEYGLRYLMADFRGFEHSAIPCPIGRATRTDASS